VYTAEFCCRIKPLAFPARRRHMRVIQHKTSGAVRHATTVGDPVRRRLYVTQFDDIKTRERRKSPRC
jgi:hypothetical protein